MEKNGVTKFASVLVVGTVVAHVTSKCILAIVPVHPKVAAVTGTVVGWYVGERLTPQIHHLVDDFYNYRYSRKN